jgi:glycosyltransferase involved in cell wall biosynthesis
VSKILLSVIVCSHNSRRDYLQRVFAALEAQTLPGEDWELVIVDNASDPPLAKNWNLSWHLNSRIVVEDELGILYARIRGLKEASAELLMFVDDDNVLDDDYLEKAVSVSISNPEFGVWGGRIRPEFEVEPDPDVKQLLGSLAINDRELLVDRWSNGPWMMNHALPPTAGMCVRKKVARAYIRLVEQDRRRLALGHQGERLGNLTGEDTDLALVACDLNYGTAQLTCLRLTHLIPAKRVEKANLLALTEQIVASGLTLGALRGKRLWQPCVSERIYRWYKIWRAKGMDKEILALQVRAEKRALQAVSQFDEV